VRKVALALVVGPLSVALLLLAAELLCRATAGSSTALAPPRYLVRGGTADGREALVPGPHPPLPGARFRVDAIPIAHASGARRLLCLGDSTVHGHPFEPPATFPDWIAARLPRLIDRGCFETFNLGVNAMNSQAVLDLAGELAPLRPDVVVVYVGHNEFLDQWLPRVRRPLSNAVARLLDRCYVGRRVRAWLGPPPGGPGDLGLRGRDRRETIHDEPLLAPEELARGERALAAALHTLVGRIRDAGALPVLVLPVCDLLDTPPEWSSFSPATSAPERERFRARLDELIERRRALEARPSDSASGADAEADAAKESRALLAALSELKAADAGVARVDYERGRLLLRVGELSAAKQALLAARDRDGHPIRAPSARLDAIRAAARETSALLVDPWPLFEAAAQDGIPGQHGLFVDYCHPDLLGHRLLAEAILRELARHGALVAPEQWRFDAEPDVADYEAEMGLSRAAQADSLARRGLFLVGESYLDAANDEPLGAADALFGLALQTDDRCALARAGRGAVALVRGESQRALAEFEAASDLDPRALDLFAEKEATVPAVKELFERNGLTIREGRARRRGRAPPGRAARARRRRARRRTRGPRAPRRRPGSRSSGRPRSPDSRRASRARR